MPPLSLLQAYGSRQKNAFINHCCFGCLSQKRRFLWRLPYPVFVLLSDQFDHSKLIFLGSPSAHSLKKIKENRIKWEFFPQGVGDGGSPILPPIPRLLFFKSVPLNGSSCAWINHHCFSLEGGGRGPLFPLLPSRSGKRTPSELAEPGIVNFKG